MPKSPWTLFPEFEGAGAINPLGELSIQKYFENHFSPAALAESLKQRDVWMSHHGWKKNAKGEWSKNGVALESDPGLLDGRLDTNHRLARALDSAITHQWMVMQLGVKQPGAIHAMVVAFRAGVDFATMMAYKRRDEKTGPREKVPPEVVEAAFQAFLSVPGNAHSKPTFEKIGKPKYWTHRNKLTRQAFTRWREWRKAKNSPL